MGYTAVQCGRALVLGVNGCRGAALLVLVGTAGTLSCVGKLVPFGAAWVPTAADPALLGPDTNGPGTGGAWPGRTWLADCGHPLGSLAAPLDRGAGGRRSGESMLTASPDYFHSYDQTLSSLFSTIMATDTSTSRFHPRLNGQPLPIYNVNGSWVNYKRDMLLEFSKPDRHCPVKPSDWFTDGTSRIGQQIRRFEYMAGLLSSDGQPITPPPADNTSGVPRGARSRTAAHRLNTEEVGSAGADIRTPWTGWGGAESGRRNLPRAPATPVTARAGWKTIEERVDEWMKDEDTYLKIVNSRESTYVALWQSLTHSGKLPERHLNDQPGADDSERLLGCPRRLLRRAEQVSTQVSTKGMNVDIIADRWGAIVMPDGGSNVEQLELFDAKVTYFEEALLSFGDEHAINDHAKCRALKRCLQPVIAPFCRTDLRKATTYAGAFQICIAVAQDYDVDHPVVVAAAAAGGGGVPKQKQDRACFKCGGTHSAFRCPQLKGKSEDELKKYVAEQCAARGWKPKEGGYKGKKGKKGTAAAALVDAAVVTAGAASQAAAPAATAAAVEPDPVFFIYNASKARMEPTTDDASTEELFRWVDGDYAPV